MRRRLAGAAVAVTLALAACGDEETTTSPTPPTTSAPKQPSGGIPTGDGRGGVRLEEIGTFEQPLYLTQPRGSEDLFVVEQTGSVMRLPGGDGEPEVFLDLSGEIACCGEQGLLSVAFAPDYERSEVLYASFTNADGDTRVVEYQRQGDVADPESAREILAVDQPFANHNGGLVLFGPDRQLYLGLGDGGSAGDPQRNAQDQSSLLGKLLRVDPDGGNRVLIEALGLRNPWRFSFDRKTDDLWIGDVGQSELEEIDAVPLSALRDRPVNFGWSAFEGTQRFNEDQEAPGHVRPVLTYGREGGCSVTGGYVVRDPELETLYGRYLYGDYCQGELRSFPAELGRPARDDIALGVQVPQLSSFGEDRRGHIYATSLEGPVYRLAPR